MIFFLYQQIRAETKLIENWGLRCFEIGQAFYTPAALSADIPNAKISEEFFMRLSENFMKVGKTFENAQFVVSTVESPAIVKRFNKIISEFDQTYQEHPDDLTMKEKVIATRDELSGYADEIAPFTLVELKWNIKIILEI